MSLWNDQPEAWHDVMPGVKRRILTHGHGVMMVLYHIGPNCTFPMHTHPQVQAGVFLEGSGKFKVGKEVYLVRKGSSYSIPSGVPHELVTDPSSSCVVLDVFAPERDDLKGETMASEKP